MKEKGKLQNGKIVHFRSKENTVEFKTLWLAIDNNNKTFSMCVAQLAYRLCGCAWVWACISTQLEYRLKLSWVRKINK